MSVINRAFTSGQPILTAYIGVSGPRMAALKAAGQPLPPPVLVNLLIDTGASGTCIDPQAVAPLGLVPSGVVQVQTPSTNGVAHTCNQYDISFMVPAAPAPPFMIPAMPIIESSLRPQGIDGLLGRDVLGQCVLIFNGHLQQYTLSY